MAACLVCGGDVRVGTLCRVHAAAVATCDDITAEQIVDAEIDAPEGWLIDQWGCTHPLASPAVIGRATSGCSPGVLHPSVSVLHAEIQGRGDSWRVVDRGSLNGTYVADEEIRTASLSSGDRVRFGDVSFFFSAGALPSVHESGKTGGTLPSRVDELSLSATLALPGGPVELVQRPGGGIVRRGDDVLLELAQLEFGLLGLLAVARADSNDPELAFVASRDLADRLDFRSRQADSDNVRELVRRVRKKLDAAGIDELIDSRQRVGYRLACNARRGTSR